MRAILPLIVARRIWVNADSPDTVVLFRGAQSCCGIQITPSRKKKASAQTHRRAAKLPQRGEPSAYAHQSRDAVATKIRGIEAMISQNALCPPESRARCVFCRDPGKLRRRCRLSRLRPGLSKDGRSRAIRSWRQRIEAAHLSQNEASGGETPRAASWLSGTTARIG